MPTAYPATDQGPQFTSAIWKSFYFAIIATVSLSGFHLQFTGQVEKAYQKMETTPMLSLH